jgi:hypothetical protein
LAHHWNPFTITLVAAWAVTTVLALVFGLRTLRLREVRHTLGWLGLACVLASVLTVAASSAAYAMGVGPMASCGGG